MDDDSNEVNVKRIEISIQELKKYMDDETIAAVILKLEDLKINPSNKELLVDLSRLLNLLGPVKGAVLTYAPYIGILLPEDPFENVQ